MTGTTDLRQALTDLIRGDGVRRASHSLELDGRNVAELFRQILASEDYVETRIEDVAIEPGERVPAFYLDGSQAYFGWVFWEIFSPDRKRKLFGSHIKNSKGDWAIMLARGARVYACPRRRESMDIDRPSSL